MHEACMYTVSYSCAYTRDLKEVLFCNLIELQDFCYRKRVFGASDQTLPPRQRREGCMWLVHYFYLCFHLELDDAG